MKIERSLLIFLNDILPKINKNKIIKLSQYMDVNTDKILNDFYKNHIPFNDIDLDEYNFGYDEMYGISLCVKLFIQQEDVSYENKLLGLIIFSCISEEDYDITELMKHKWATLYVINCMVYYTKNLQGSMKKLQPGEYVSISNAICTLGHNYKQEYTLLKKY